MIYHRMIKQKVVEYRGGLKLLVENKRRMLEGGGWDNKKGKREKIIFFIKGVRHREDKWRMNGQENKSLQVPVHRPRYSKHLSAV